jgi:hypothetical protein
MPTEQKNVVISPSRVPLSEQKRPSTVADRLNDALTVITNGNEEDAFALLIMTGKKRLLINGAAHELFSLKITESIYKIALIMIVK